MSSNLEEIGDLLLVSVNLARHLTAGGGNSPSRLNSCASAWVNPEIALKNSCKKFSRRFQYIEERVAASGRDLFRSCTLAELDAYWTSS